MGMFDEVIVDAEDTRFTCSNGHPITELQTKSFGQTMGRILVGQDEVRIEDGRSDHVYRMLHGSFSCYAQTRRPTSVAGTLGATSCPRLRAARSTRGHRPRLSQ